MTIDVRAATADDITEMLLLGRQFHRESDLAHAAPFHAPSFERSLKLIMTGATPGALIVAADNSGAIGMAGGVVFPAFFNMDVKIAQELFWWVEPEKRGVVGIAMLDMLERDMRKQGAVAMISAAVAGLRDEAVGRLYARRGYKALENTYIKVLTE